jgi:hypothetical protein
MGDPGSVEGDNSLIGVPAWDATLARRRAWMTRVESSVTALSWIPLDAMEGMGKLAADLGSATGTCHHPTGSTISTT